MKIKKTAAFLLALITALCFAACAKSARPETVRALFCTQEKLEKLQNARSEAEESLLDAIEIDGISLLRDSETGAFYYSLPKGKSTGGLSAAWQGKNGVRIGILKDFEGESLPLGETLTLLAYTKTEWQSLELIATPLPIMSLTTDIETEKIEKETDTGVTMTLYDNREAAGLPVVKALGKMHVRGRGSSNYPKKGYRLTLCYENGEENDMALLGLRNDGDWILYADYAETDKVRQVYTARLWREGCGTDNALGADTSNDYKFIELFLNGRYWGLYALGYPVDKKQLDLSEGDYSYFKENPMVTETEQDYTVPGETPGYELAGGETENRTEAEIWQPLNDYYKTLLETDWENRSVLYDLADLSNAMDAWLFIDLIQGKDQMLAENRLYNMYITVKQSESGAKALFTPWDFDRTWGYVLGDNNSNNLELTPKDHVEMTLNPVSRLIAWEETDMIDALKAQWQKLRAGAWSDENAQAILDGYEADIFASGVYERDYARWPDSGHNAGQTDLSSFRKYVKERFAEMDDYVKKLGVKEGTA